MARTALPLLLLLAIAAGCSSSNGGTTPTPVLSGSPATSPTPSGGPLPPGSVTFYGADAGDRAGGVIAGDFNGDGVMDVAVGASMGDGPDNRRTDAGEVYVFLGPFPDGGALDAGQAEYDAIFYGAEAGDNLGRALAAADFNADGTDDLVMAAPAASGQAGAVYVMFGAALRQETDLASAEPDVLLRGAAGQDFAGIAMTTGDLDGDGVAELVIGALLADGPTGARADAGAVYLVQGQELTAGDEINLGSLERVVHGAEAGDHLGEALATGDVTGDGLADVVVVGTFSAGPDGTRPGAGVTYVLASPVSYPVDLATAAPQLMVVGADEGDQLGHSIAVADTNLDGIDDLWLGAVSADGPGNSADLAGEGVLVTPAANQTGIVDAAADVLPIVYGPGPEARLGRSAAMGNLFGDEGAEMLMAAPNVAGRAGAVYILAAREVPLSADEAPVILRGVDEGDILGHESFGSPALLVAGMTPGSVAVLVVAPGGDGPGNDRTDAGEVYLIPGERLSPAGE